MKLRALAVAGNILATAIVATPASSATVHINDPGLPVDSIGTIVVGAKYRYSNTNFDQSLDAGGGTTLVSGVPNFLGRDRGNRAALDGALHSFVFEHRSGEGFIFSLTNPGGVTWTQAWGTFAPPVVADQSIAQLPATAATGQPVGTLLAPGLPYNALHLEWRATPIGATTPTVIFSDLSFVSPGLTQIGSLVTGGTVLQAGNPVNPNFPDPNGNFYSQWLVADVNLASFDWTLSGKVSLSSSPIPGGAGGDELVRFDVSGKQVAFTPPDDDVPAPASLALFGLGALALAGMRRR
jgi:hypothetical protein